MLVRGHHAGRQIVTHRQSIDPTTGASNHVARA
jgi:hypothetical protein